MLDRLPGASHEDAASVPRALSTRSDAAILNQMVRYSGGVLDRTFAALADAQRREILDRLGSGPLSISELAAPLDMSLPGVLKHVRVLEEAHLVETRKEGRVRWCRLAGRPLEGAAAWIDQRRERWERRLDLFARQVEATKAPTG